MYQTCEVIRLCDRYHVPVTLENPRNSMLFEAPPLAKLARTKHFSESILSQCAYGTPWHKATKIQGWHAGTMSKLAAKCVGKKGTCSFTGKHHIILSGTDGANQLWTSRAQAYPPKLCRALALTRAEAADELQTVRLLGLSGLRSLGTKS